MLATQNWNKVVNRASLNTFMKGIRAIYVDCMKDPGPRCPKYTKVPVSKKEDCRFFLRKNDTCLPAKSFVSVWQETDCGRDCSCLAHYLRHDDLYLQRTDSRKRKCQQTWVDYPESKMCPVECSLPPATNVIEPEKRMSRKPHYSGACEKCDNLNFASFKKCRLPDDKNCVKIRVPGCRSTLGCSRCTKARPINKCKKLCTPYPSYSECDWEKMKEYANAHCKCLVIPVRCDLFESMEKTEKINQMKPPKLEEKRTSLT